MKTRFALLTLLGLLFMGNTQAQVTDSLPYRHFVGSTLFMLANFAPNPPVYYQLNYGYRLTPKDVISVEAITWTYNGPLGRQYGPHFDNPDSNFPGKVQAIGAGLAYKHFWWKGLYNQVHATAFRQNYLDESGVRIQQGFQLFCTLRMGYQINFFHQRLWLEPSVAVTSWPINTNLPESFQVLEDQFPKFFLFEPGLHFGVNF